MNEWLTDPNWEWFRSKELQRPAPLGRQLLRWLDALSRIDQPMRIASRQFSRLRVMGYVTVKADGYTVQITEAGRAQLRRQESRPTAGNDNAQAAQLSEAGKPNDP